MLRAAGQSAPRHVATVAPPPRAPAEPYVDNADVTPLAWLLPTCISGIAWIVFLAALYADGRRTQLFKALLP